MAWNVKGWLTEALCAAASYVLTRWIWWKEDKLFSNLPFELLTFAVIYLLTLFLVRGRKYVKKGKQAD